MGRDECLNVGMGPEIDQKKRSNNNENQKKKMRSQEKSGHLFNEEPCRYAVSPFRVGRKATQGGPGRTRS